MASIVDNYHTENKRRKFDFPDTNTADSMDSQVNGWHTLQPILENDVLCAKIPSSDVALDLLTKWFQIIAGDKEKLRVFRQWIMSSSEGDAVKQLSQSAPSPSQLVPIVKLSEKRDLDDPSIDDVPSTDTSAKAASIDFINNEIPITPRSTPQVLLLQQLLQQQQQQIVMLQKLQPAAESTAVVPTASTITLNPTSGSAGVVVNVQLKSSPQWHPFSETCTCTLGFTTHETAVTVAHRIAGGVEGEMRFIVPPISFPSQDATQLQMAVHLTSCSAPHAPLVSADSFAYGRERASSAAASYNSDDDSEDTPDSSVCDDEEDEDHGERTASSSSPKQLMTVRERMLEFVHTGAAAKGPVRVVLAQAPPTRVVWKNRRLDTPFKIKVEGVACDTPSTKLAALALVVDHKGKLQIDAMENFDEECNPQGIALFHNLRMTKGTWGKEWSITFVVVVKASLAGNNPVVLGVSQACPVVVKTRKNPQVRHVNRSDSPISFVERRKPDTSIRKRNRVEDILDGNMTSSPHTQSPSLSSSSSSTSSARSHSEAMTNLLYAAEIKQQEREYRPPPHHPHPHPSAAPSSAPLSPPTNMLLPSVQRGFSSPDPNFANLQGLLGYLEEIKMKHHPSLNIVEQPQLKRDGKVLIVKKGKPFRTPFRLQMRTTPPPHNARTNYANVPDYNPQQYVCVAVLRNDKGEEVALKNSEVLFDARGLATFSGLMVMKGTWGKSVQLTFEARWSGARRIVGGSNWPPLRMLVISETPALQLMCYTKDKKAPSAV